MPGRAIFSEDEVPEGMENFIELNAELAEIWPNITEKKGRPAGRRRVGWQARQDCRPGALIAPDAKKALRGLFVFCGKKGAV
jgi:hypothetical protein